ncbi:OLC1v1014609C1 [Oldenlandia corymbosa var. corymbosa]|uniref:OLC1v1014609C1 n=1 Tax=Oldenlandia corymbosa var. corymbosa TaxID=529605 RepID=A0AAV1E1E8_OLDCO|nr:OLC1v1014609C1 [Oldenlandia corymbosa var. corymbosa]
MEVHLGDLPSPLSLSQSKRRKLSLDGKNAPLPCQNWSKVEALLPTLLSPEYFTDPCLSELAIQEFLNPGYCSRVLNFTVGRYGYGYVIFTGRTDVRWLDLDQIVKFRRHELVIYEDESTKPAVGEGLNKAAEVTLLVQTRKPIISSRIAEKLRLSTERQGAKFLSFNPSNGEWKFLVQHFSRFGFNEDDEEDIAMDDASPEVQNPLEHNAGDISDIEEEEASVFEPTSLSHSLPAHLGLDPIKMKEMKMLMFPGEDEDEEFDGTPSVELQPFSKESIRAPLQHSSEKTVRKESPPFVRKTPLPLIEYNPGSFCSSSPGSILMAKQNKGAVLRTTKAEGFKLDLKKHTPVTDSQSKNIVDAALFMGRSFRVGWGPNGVLVHSGMPVGSGGTQSVLSSVVHLERVAIDRVARDENNNVQNELVDFCFDTPLDLHKEMDHDIEDIQVGSFKLKLQKPVCDRSSLSEICRGYIGIIERQLEVSGVSSAARVLLMHQAMIWELIRVLFSSGQMGRPLKSAEVDQEEDMMTDVRADSPDADPESLPLRRRAEFSCWLQESVCHRVQEDISSLSDSCDLEHIFLLLTGRQLDAAVELAASRGDVRLACLLSQAGGSMVNRSDIFRQLDTWRINGMDFSFIEEDRVRLLELLAGNIQGALQGVKIDWKRFLGLLMWYELPPDTSLPVIFRKYQQLLENGRASNPVPVYVDEGLVEKSANPSVRERYDLGYYLMLLHSSPGNKFGHLKTMFSTFASTNDTLDYHMIWHYRSVLEAIGAFNSDDLHILDMGLISQLLCLGKCHWAIYVVLHIPHRKDYPCLHAMLIREILFQYCEDWSADDSQRQFIEDLGVPSAWMHEALATYLNYYGDSVKALDHFLECGNWQKAHSIFMTSVAHSLFLSDKHTEIWQLAYSMEDHKSEIEDWDLGAGLYILFYSLRSSLQDENITRNELDTLEKKNDACTDFISRLNKSLAVWGSRVPIDARVVYSKMAEKICNLLVSESDENSPIEVQLSCYANIFRAPLPEDLRSCHLQDAVSLFTSYISEAAS